MKILFADTTMDGHIVGGAHTFLVKLMGSLTAGRHDVHFLSKGDPAAKSSMGIDESGAIIHRAVWTGSVLVDDATPEVAKWVNELRPAVFVVSVSPDIGWTVMPHLDPRIATLAIGHNDQEAFYAPARHYSKFLTRVVGVSSDRAAGRGIRSLAAAAVDGAWCESAYWTIHELARAATHQAPFRCSLKGSAQQRCWIRSVRFAPIPDDCRPDFRQFFGPSQPTYDTRSLCQLCNVM
jgi:hypothetical protein